MSKFDRVLSDAELISATYKAEVDGTMGELRAVEQAVLEKLAEQEPVAWTSAEIMSGPSFVDDDDYAVMYKTKSHLLDDFCGYPEATPVPLYTNPMPCVSHASNKTACVSENGESDRQQPVAWRVHPFDYGVGVEGAYAITQQESQKQAWVNKGWAVTPLYGRPIPNSQGFLDSSNHIADASKMLTPLAHRKIQSKLAEDYRKIENTTVLVNEHGRAAIVNHGGAFYWVENSALAREYDGRPIPINSCRPTETNKKGVNE